jgi:hypothetical protein
VLLERVATTREVELLHKLIPSHRASVLAKILKKFVATLKVLIREYRWPPAALLYKLVIVVRTIKELVILA